MASRTFGAMCGGSLCPAISSRRSFVGRVVRGEVGLSTHPPRAARPPLERPLSFALAAREVVYLFAVGMSISPPLVRAACPRQNAEECRDLKNLRGPRSMCNLRRLGSALAQKRSPLVAPESSPEGRPSVGK